MAKGGLIDVYLHRTQSETWSLTPARGKQPEIVTSPEAVLLGLPPSTPRRARVVGFPSNTELIAELFQLRQKLRFTAVEVCSPRCIPEERARLGGPEEILWTAANWSTTSGKAGSWRAFDKLDSLTYSLASAPDNELDGLFAQHPLCKPLTFVTGLDRNACARLIGLIRDPRWFVDAQHPQRVNRLTSFLGLTPYVQRAVAGLTPPVRGCDRCSLVSQAWKGSDQSPPGWQTDPGSFLWRAYDRYDTGWKADLRASTKFIKFLSGVWLDQVCRTGDGLFVPEQFFDLGEAAAFEDHCQTATQV